MWVSNFLNYTLLSMGQGLWWYKVKKQKMPAKIKNKLKLKSATNIVRGGFIPSVARRSLSVKNI